ncbi:hypothetical protein WJX73_000291 [Symbiochloris irregularis]|uniref:Mitochondrial carrier protein n=1 Tax=Symbiochloris irregularis TaxID=706552 RepID=A0AAW1P126_9CHLO
MVVELHTPDESSALQQRFRQLPFLAKELLAGGMAGGLAKTCVAPLERVKILFQTGRTQATSITGTLAQIYSSEGLQGLFRGNGASVLRIVPYSAFHFGAYEHYRTHLIHMAGYDVPPSKHTQTAARHHHHHTDPESHHVSPPPTHHAVPPVLDLLAGSTAGATAVLLTYPLDFARTRLAYEVKDRTSSGQGSSISSVLVQTVKLEGPQGIYRGIAPTLAGILPYAGLKFYVYQSLKQYYRRTDEHARDRLPIAVMLSFGASAGLVAQTITYPLDVVRRQMQVQGQKGRSGLIPQHINSTVHGLKLLWLQGGRRALFRGLSLNYIKVVPSTAIGFAIYDYLKQYLDLPQNL